MNGRNLAQHELIGLDVNIITSTDPTKNGKAGRVIDETRNMLVIENRERNNVIKVQKCGTVFEFASPGGSVKLSGDDICFRPEDRIKKNR